MIILLRSNLINSITKLSASILLRLEAGRLSRKQVVQPPEHATIQYDGSFPSYSFSGVSVELP
jgi:hypothetical protein